MIGLSKRENMLGGSDVTVNVVCKCKCEKNVIQFSNGLPLSRKIYFFISVLKIVNNNDRFSQF